MIEPTAAAIVKQRAHLAAAMTEIEKCRCTPGTASWAWIDGGFRILIEHFDADCPGVAARVADEVDADIAGLDAFGRPRRAGGREALEVG